ncbi:uncharacterized protein LOC128246826 isoform X2 [Mya arenaria]|uniref:uncharacterized protein LOC128246826 isoform X2 n=1 Tax=Mya arenaria TaxID=6604 RepID=UPI0022E76980|nr:uncharacterized protein LOC128246826 isoform X2 [Mya arenaria]
MGNTGSKTEDQCAIQDHDSINQNDLDGTPVDGRALEMERQQTSVSAAGGRMSESPGFIEVLSSITSRENFASSTTSKSTGSFVSVGIGHVDNGFITPLDIKEEQSNQEQQPQFCNHVSSIRQNFIFLLEELSKEDIRNVLDILYQEHEITEDFMEKVNILSTRREKARMLLQKLLRLKATAYEAFLAGLVNSDHCKDYVINKLHESTLSIALCNCALSKEQMVDLLSYNRNVLKGAIDEPEMIGDYFTVFDDKFETLQENIASEKRQRDKVKEIIKFVKKRLPERFCIFQTALKEMHYDEVFEIMNKPCTNRQQGIEYADTVEQHNWPSVVCSSCGIDPGQLTNVLKVSEATDVQITFENQRLHKIILQNYRKNRCAINVKLMEKGVLLLDMKEGSIILRLKRTGRLPLDIYQHVIGWLQTVLCNEALLPEYRTSCERFDAKITPVEIRDSLSDAHDAYDIIRYNKSFLAEELDANVYIEYLYRKGHISDKDKKCIVRVENRRGKMMTLLTVILNNPPIVAEDFLNEVENSSDNCLRRRLRPDKIASTLYIANNLMDVFPGVIEILPLRIMTHELQDWPMPDDVQQFLQMDVPRKTKATVIVQYVLASDETIRCRFVQILRDKDLIPNEVLHHEEKHALTDNTLSRKSGEIERNCFSIGEFHVLRFSSHSRTRLTLQKHLEKDSDTVHCRWFNCLAFFIRLFSTSQYEMHQMEKTLTTRKRSFSADSGYTGSYHASSMKSLDRDRFASGMSSTFSERRIDSSTMPRIREFNWDSEV